MLTSARLFLRRNYGIVVAAQRRLASQEAGGLSNNNSVVVRIQRGWNANHYQSLWFATFAVIASTTTLGLTPKSSKLDALPTSGDVILLGATKEKATGILFPKQCNGFTLAGTGVRIKYGFVKVYAALLDPMYPRTIRIVMARGLSIQKFTDALSESLKPRMNGEDLHTLEEFAKLNPSVDLVQGAEMELTIRGDTLLYKNALGGVGRIQSVVFTRALCDVYYGHDAVSAPHRDAVLEGVSKL
ncbi:hypothetical protein MHU86_1226 [Fragilaria crotonensis]|nr:hypothetical protein MHU86_1226 [Fragilaria crotonensis]